MGGGVSSPPAAPPCAAVGVSRPPAPYLPSPNFPARCCARRCRGLFQEDPVLGEKRPDKGLSPCWVPPVARALFTRDRPPAPWGHSAVTKGWPHGMGEVPKPPLFHGVPAALPLPTHDLGQGRLPLWGRGRGTVQRDRGGTDLGTVAPWGSPSPGGGLRGRAPGAGAAAVAPRAPPLLGDGGFKNSRARSQGFVATLGLVFAPPQGETELRGRGSVLQEPGQTVGWHLGALKGSGGGPRWPGSDLQKRDPRPNVPAAGGAGLAARPLTQIFSSRPPPQHQMGTEPGGGQGSGTGGATARPSLVPAGSDSHPVPHPKSPQMDPGAAPWPSEGSHAWAVAPSPGVPASGGTSPNPKRTEGSGKEDAGRRAWGWALPAVAPHPGLGAQQGPEHPRVGFWVLGAP